MEKYYINELKKMVTKALKRNEVPVGTIIVCNNKIISKSYNKRVKSNNVLMHAEIDAIIKASKKLNDWRLSECEMYVTLKPCDMCLEVIKASRIKKVYYLLDKEKEVNLSTEFIMLKSDYSAEYKRILSEFFKLKR